MVGAGSSWLSSVIKRKHRSESRVRWSRRNLETLNIQDRLGKPKCFWGWIWCGMSGATRQHTAAKEIFDDVFWDFIVLLFVFAEWQLVCWPSWYLSSRWRLFVKVKLSTEIIKIWKYIFIRSVVTFQLLWMLEGFYVQIFTYFLRTCFNQGHNFQEVPKSFLLGYFKRTMCTYLNIVMLCSQKPVLCIIILIDK